MEHQEFLDFVAKYGELHHDGDVWRAYAYFTAQDGDQQCQPQRPNDPAKIFVDSVPDVWPAAVSYHSDGNKIDMKEIVGG